MATQLTTYLATGNFTGQTSTTLASAATVAIGASFADYINISGTTAITAFDSAPAGQERTLKFAGALTLTHNATSLILPTGVNITTAANDIAVFRSEGSGNWRCVDYQRYSGASLDKSSTTLASAATVNIGTTSADYITITGTTTITAFNSVPVGIERTLRFAGAVTLTHNATSLILPGGANYTTAAGDVFVFRSEGSGNWRCVNYMLASGQSLASGGGMSGLVATLVFGG